VSATARSTGVFARRLLPISILVVVGLAGAVAAQQPQPAAGPSTRPADAVDQTAVVVKVVGHVRAAAVPAEGQPITWRDVKLGDRLPPATQLQTGLRSSVLLQFGDNIIVKIDRATSASIGEYYRSAATQTVRVDLGHGEVRAGVAQGAVETDMTIATPVATLTRRGTWNFGVEYDPSTRNFRMFVDEHGLAEVLNQLTNQRREISSNEYITQAMIMWVETARFDRHVSIQDMLGMKGPEQRFQALFESGTSVIGAGAGYDIWNEAGLNRTALYSDIIAAQRQAAQGFRVPRLAPPVGPNVIDRPEGNFGTGGSLLPNSPR
jgi:hypothetical protein